MSKLKTKLHYYIAEKNWGVRREYDPYMNIHKEKYEKHRLKRLCLLFRLNWHYRILRSREWLLPFPAHPQEDFAYRLPSLLIDSSSPKNYHIAFCAYRLKGSKGGPGGVNTMLQQILGEKIEDLPLHYYYDSRILYPRHLTKVVSVHPWVIRAVFCAAYFIQNKMDIWSVCDNENDVFFVCHDVGTAYGVSLCGKKFVLVYHQQGSLVNETLTAGVELSDEEIGILNKVEEIVMNAAQTVYFPSDGARAEYLSNCAFDYSKVHFSKPLYNTVLDTPENLDFDGVAKEFGISKINRDEYQIFLTAGDYNLNKGIDRIPAVLNEYAKKCSKKVLWIAAGNKHQTGIFEKMQEEKANWNFETVLYGARIPHEKILALMELCDFYIMLHRKSIFDLATLEAMRAGLVPVLSNVGGNPEFDRENNIILINPEMPEEAANKMLDCDLQNMQEKNKRVFENYFSMDNFAKTYTDMIKEELSRL